MAEQEKNVPGIKCPQWPNGTPAAIVGSNHTHGLDVCVLSVVCCQVEVSATDWSFVQRSPTDCGASLCLIKKPR